jgi:UDP-N-acetylglucosamine transferase subunit ALG13
MILVITGLHKQQFERLVKKMDEIANETREEIVIQIGHTNYRPKCASFFSFLDNKEIEELYEKADIVVTHGGVGSIMDALSHNKPVIAVPRLAEFGEHVDNHQLDIVRCFSKLGLVDCVYNIEELETKINIAKKSNSGPNVASKAEKSRLVACIRSYLEGLK